MLFLQSSQKLNQRLVTFKKNFTAPFYGWGSTPSRLEPVRGGTLLFTTKFPEIPGTQLQVLTEGIQFY